MNFDTALPQFIYRHLISPGAAPKVSEIARGLSCSVPKVRAGLKQLSQTHALGLQENGELWRAAPFSAKRQVIST